jgi:DNA-binding NtrC family response regulator
MSARHRPAMLIVDDDAGSSGLLREIFHSEGFDTTIAGTGAEALRLASEHPYDIVLSDVQLPDIDGIEVLRRLRPIAPETTVILVTAFGTVETAIRALHEGAFDYVRKPFKLEEVRVCVERAMERRRLRQAARAEGPVTPPGGVVALGGGATATRPGRQRQIIGGNPAMVELFKLVSRVAGTKSSVLIEGESGTGKELIARTIHEASPRRHRPFVAVNCTSLSETLLESELFGHVKGAFTGAIERRPGLFLEANRGTVFLDEVGDMSLSMQAKLLRVLQEQEVKPVGGTETPRPSAPRASRRHPPSRDALPPGVQPAVEPPSPGILGGSHGGPGRLPLARERARARKRGRAGGGDGARLDGSGGRSPREGAPSRAHAPVGVHRGGPAHARGGGPPVRAPDPGRGSRP